MSHLHRKSSNLKSPEMVPETSKFVPKLSPRSAGNELYKLNIGQIPDKLYHVDTPVEKLLERCETVASTCETVASTCETVASTEGSPVSPISTTKKPISTPKKNEVMFPPGSLYKVDKIPLHVNIERCIGIPLYLLLNLLPFTVVIICFLMGLSWCFTEFVAPIVLPILRTHVTSSVFNCIGAPVLNFIGETAIPYTIRILSSLATDPVVNDLPSQVGIVANFVLNSLKFGGDLALTMTRTPSVAGSKADNFGGDIFYTGCLMFNIGAMYLLKFLGGYLFTLMGIWVLYFYPYFSMKYPSLSSKSSMKEEILKLDNGDKKKHGIRCAQYTFTERNITKYSSINFVWGKKLHRFVNCMDVNLSSKGDIESEFSKSRQPFIFAVVPHGVAPMGITAYPLWSKLFNSNLTRWTAAPIVLKIPLVGHMIKRMGYIGATTKNIERVLNEGGQNVGIILDGIAGMFQTKQMKQMKRRGNERDINYYTNETNEKKKDKIEEYAYLKERKGIVKIALRTGTPIVPVYGFGHTQMWTIKVDPFGILKKISLKFNTSVVPFFGRPFGLWFIGPPFRVPVTICCGDPVMIPKMGEKDINQAIIDKYHQQMIDGFIKVFDKHKTAYYGEEEGSKRVLTIV